MAEPNTFPFHSIDDEHLFSLLQNDSLNNPPNNNQTYDEEIVNVIVNNQEELTFNVDPNDEAGHIVPSKYYTENQFKSYTEVHGDELFFLHLNIRSVNRNLENLRLLLENTNVPKTSILGLTETWFSQSPDNLHNINGFNLVTKSRLRKRGGGVAFYIPTQYDYTVHDEMSYMNDILESLFIEIAVPKSKSLTVGIIYRPPQSNQNEFLNIIQDLLQNITLRNKDCIIMGDFNINLLTHNHSPIAHEFLEVVFLAASFLPLISKPTRVTEHSALLDNIFTDTPTPPPNLELFLLTYLTTFQYLLISRPHIT